MSSGDTRTTEARARVGLLTSFALCASGFLAASGCGAAAEPPPPPRAATCPSATPALPSAAPATTAVATAVATAEPAPTPSEPRPSKLLWYEIWSSGDVLIRRHRDGIAVVPAFLGATIEGPTVAVLDPAGLEKWERPREGTGAADAAVAPDGSIVTIAVDHLDWPKTKEAYEQRRIATFTADGKKVRSFRLPEGVAAESVDVDVGGNLLVTGYFTGDRKVGTGILLHAAAGEQRGFVAGLGADGHAQWAHDFKGTVLASPAPAGKVIVLQTPDETGAPGQRLFSMDGAGHEDWSVDVPATCHVRSVAAAAGPGIAVVAPRGCFSGAAPPAAGASCALYRLDAATGKKTGSFDLPECSARADEGGAVSITEDHEMTLFDAAGKARWTTSLVIPEVCLNLGFEVTSVALDASSIWVAGACAGQRIGTMFNSPYSRASDKSSTYIGRYDRR